MLIFGLCLSCTASCVQLHASAISVGANETEFCLLCAGETTVFADTQYSG